MFYFLVCYFNLLALPGQGQAVAQLQQRHGHPGIVLQLGVERLDGPGIGVAGGVLDHFAVPKHVVDRGQAAWAQQRQRAFVVAVIVGLVGVDESKIEACRLAPRWAWGEQAVQGLERQRKWSSILSATPASAQ